MTATARKSASRTQIPPPENGGFSHNQRLTQGRQREAVEVAGAIARLLGSLRARAERGDIGAFADMITLRSVLAGSTLRAAQGLHQGHGYSWAEIGRAAGISQQAAHKRWGKA